MTSSGRSVKSAYSAYHDRISEKRSGSPFWLRRFAHQTIHERFMRHVSPGAFVLDAGCGEGALSKRLTEVGARVIGVDISLANVEAAATHSTVDGPAFVVADLEALPFEDRAVDLVVSSHALEHAPDPDLATLELRRVTRGRVIIAMPTCLNPAAWVLLGGDVYWKLTRRSPYAIFLGIARTLAARVRSEDGPNEGYAGSKELPHVWRFPRRLLAMIRGAGLSIEDIEAGPLLLPYVCEYISAFRRVQVWVDRFRQRAVVRWLGFGTHVTATRSDHT